MAPTRVTITQGAIAQELDGQVMLLSMDNGRYYRLDEVGSRVWLVLQEAGELDAVVARLLGEFDVDEATLRADVERLVGELAAAGLVQTEP